MQTKTISHIVTKLADGTVAVISSWTGASAEEQYERFVYRSEGEYKHNLRLTRQMGDARQGLLK